MSKRKVSAALHRELSEYASLLRALRTRDTMDVTKHLTKPSPFAMPITEVDSTADLPMDSSRGGSSSGSNDGRTTRKRHIPRDHWTRWPLMLHDVLRPEWTLEDEVAVLASRVLKARPVPYSESPEDCPSDPESQDDFVVLDMEVEDDDPDAAFYVPSLTYIIANYLSTILAELASYTPPRPPSMQNRIEPLNWRAVIDAVVSCGNTEYANPEVVQRVIRRMEAIYGPSSSSPQTIMLSNAAVERIQNRATTAEQCHELYEKGIEEIFTQASRPTNKIQ